ncbi:DUF397 domain-containing protein [Streptomyces sp. NPDC002490]|uniref:DUF397 domain-containing protein n=1 Tax=Streptomyces sp. NPDC002490 TaxID=3154416 RepID=UPI00332BE512
MITETWAVSSYSMPDENCVEARCSRHPTGEATEVAVRDTKWRTGPMLSLGSGAWSAFVAGLRREDGSA